MNYLDLCKRVHKLAQVQGQFGSVTDVGINGEIAQLVSDCWVDIQKFRKDWLFMFKTLAFNMTVGKNTYTLAELFPNPGSDDLGYWKLIHRKASCYRTDPDDEKKREVLYVEYESFRHHFKNRSDEQRNPRFWTYHPSTYTLEFVDVPDKAYLIEIDYYRTPQILTENANIPHIRSKWHELIVYKALADFSSAKSIAGLNQKYEIKYASEIGELMREQVPGREAEIREVA